MPWIARRGIRFRGQWYDKGDVVPAEQSPRRRVLVATNLIKWVEAEAAQVIAEVKSDLGSLTRAELNDHAKTQGVVSPEKLPNKDAVVEAITQAQAAPSGPTGVTGPASGDASGVTGPTADDAPTGVTGPTGTDDAPSDATGPTGMSGPADDGAPS